MFQVVHNGRRFAVERDIVNLFPHICKRASIGMSQTALMPAVADFAAHTGASMPDFTVAFEALAKMLNVYREQRIGENDFAAIWINSGMAAVPQAAMVCMLSYIGMAVMEYYCKYAREAMPAQLASPGMDLMQESIGRAVHAIRATTKSGNLKRVEDNARRLDDMGYE